jgi:enoyl-CoA hydratase/carnithine racemase
VRAIKQSIVASRWRPLDACLAAEAEAQQICWESPDVSEGLRASVEKRPPSFARTLPIASHATGFE